MANRDAVSGLGSSAGSTTLVITFSGAQPVAGDKVIAGFWISGSVSVNSIVDNGAVQGTYSLEKTQVDTGPTNAVWIYRLDNVVLPSTGQYKITITFSGAPAEADGGAVALSGVKTGAAVATNGNNSSNTPATTGAVNSTAPAYYFAVVTNDTGANPATFTWASPFSRQVTQTNGSTQQAGSIGDDINDSGSRNASITIDTGAAWSAAIAVWQTAPSNAYSGVAPNVGKSLVVPGGFFQTYSPPAIFPQIVTNPFKVPASTWTYYFDRPIRRRDGPMYSMPDQQNVIAPLVTSNPIVNVADNSVINAEVPVRRRTLSIHLHVSSTTTQFSENQIGTPGIENWTARTKPSQKHWLRDFAWATAYGTLLVSPLKNSVSYLILSLRHLARRRFGALYSVPDQNSTNLFVPLALPSTNPADLYLQSLRVPLRRRTPGLPLSVSSFSSPQKDQIVVLAKDLTWSSRIKPSLKHWLRDYSWAAVFGTLLTSPLKNSVSVLVQAARKVLRRRSGTLYQITDSANAINFASGNPEIGVPGASMQAYRVPVRRRVSAVHHSTTVASTQFQDRIIVHGLDNIWISRVRPSNKHWLRDWSWLPTGFAPFKVAASYMVQSVRKALRRRSGSLYQLTDQSNIIQILLSNPVRQPATSTITTAKKRPIHRVSSWFWQTSETSTSESDVAIARTRDHGWLGQVKPNPKMWIRDWSWALFQATTVAIFTFTGIVVWVRDGSLKSRIRDGSLISYIRDGSRKDRTR